MIDLTPLDVRKKRGDFGKGLRGYDAQEVDGFLELVAERMEVLVRENLAFREQIERLGEQVVIQEGREKAVQDALVTAQELRQDMEKQAAREAELMERQARARISGMVAESEKLLAQHRAALQELGRHRDRFLKALRTFLERQLDTVEVELGRDSLEGVTLDFELGQSPRSIGEGEDEADADAHEVSAPEADVTAEMAEMVETAERGRSAETSEVAEAAGVAETSKSAKAAEPGEAGEAAEETTTTKGSGTAAGLEAARVATLGDDALEAGPEASAEVPAEGRAKAEAKAKAEAAGPAEELLTTEAGGQRAPEEEDGEDSLWLSSIMMDRKEESTE